VESYRSDDAPFLAASGTQGLNDLLLQTFHNVVTAFSPLHGVSTNDFKSQYFQREAESFLESVRDPEPNDE
jgi:hypothetical protein